MTPRRPGARRLVVSRLRRLHRWERCGLAVHRSAKPGAGATATAPRRSRRRRCAA